MAYQFLEAKPEVLSGKMCVKGTRISADLILEWLAQASKPEDILEIYLQINKEAIYEAVQYASHISKIKLIFEV